VEIQDCVRRLVDRLGYQVVELPLSRDKTECCGFGGLMSFSDPELAAKVSQRRVSECGEPYVAYCAICRDFFASQGKPTWHLLDLIFGMDTPEQAARKRPGYSQLRDNRIRLQQELVEKLWGERMPGREEYAAVELVISPEIKGKMEERMILEDDLRQVIHDAERSGKKLLDQATGHFLAHAKLGIVTYWVEYSPGDGGYKVHNTYSHRMQIVGD
jgi:hypothetical protein